MKIISFQREQPSSETYGMLLSIRYYSLSTSHLYRAIAHDEEVYPDPFTFDPSRHLGDKPQLDPFKFTFGFGRRVCPGAHLAEMTLFLNIATILTVFNISKPVDGEGNEVEPKIEWVNGITSYVIPFFDISLL